MKEEIRKALEEADLLPDNRELAQIDEHIIGNCYEWLRWQNERIEELERALERITVTFDKMPMVEIARKALKGDPK